MSKLWGLEMLLNRMNNHYNYYDNNMKVEDVKPGDTFWLVGYNMPLTFIKIENEKLIFDGNMGETNEYTAEEFKKLIPSK